MYKRQHRVIWVADCQHRLHRSSWRKHATAYRADDDVTIRATEPRTSRSNFRCLPENIQAELDGSHRHGVSHGLSNICDTETLRRQAGSAYPCMVQQSSSFTPTSRRVNRVKARMMVEQQQSSSPRALLTTDHPTVVDILRQRGRTTTNNRKFIRRRERCHALGLGVDCSEQTSVVSLRHVRQQCF